MFRPIVCSLCAFIAQGRGVSKIYRNTGTSWRKGTTGMGTPVETSETRETRFYFPSSLASTTAALVYLFK